MTLLRILIAACLLVQSACALAPRSRPKGIPTLTPGTKVRVKTATGIQTSTGTHSSFEGKVVALGADTLTIRAKFSDDSRRRSRNDSERLLARNRPAEVVRVPLSTVESLSLRNGSLAGPGFMWGAGIGALAGAIGIATSSDERRDVSHESQFIALPNLSEREVSAMLLPVAVLTGGLYGAIIGRFIPDWKTAPLEVLAQPGSVGMRLAFGF